MAEAAPLKLPTTPRVLQASIGNSYKCNTKENVRLMKAFQSTYSACECRLSRWRATRPDLWRNVSWRRKKHADPHFHGQRPDRPDPHCLHCPPHLQDVESRWLPQDPAPHAWRQTQQFQGSLFISLSLRSC